MSTARTPRSFVQRLRQPESVPRPSWVLLLVVAAAVVFWRNQPLNLTLLGIQAAVYLAAPFVPSVGRIGYFALGVVLALQAVFFSSSVYWVPGALAVCLTGLGPQAKPNSAPVAGILAGIVVAGGAVLAALWATDQLALFTAQLRDTFSESILHWSRPAIVALFAGLVGLLVVELSTGTGASAADRTLQKIYLAGAIASLAFNASPFRLRAGLIALVAWYLVLYRIQTRSRLPAPIRIPRATKVVSFLSGLIGRSHFPEVANPEGEVRRLGMVRWIVAVIALYRTAMIGYVEYLSDPSVSESAQTLVRSPLAFCVAECALLVLVAVGFATPLSCLLVFATYIQMDLVVETHTLGSSMLVLLMFAFGLCGAGKTWSIDALLLQRSSGAVGRSIGRLYSIVGRRDAQEFAVVYFLLLLSYALTSFGAVLYHVDDAYWMSGQTVQALFTNAYLCRFYDVWRQVEQLAGQLFGLSSAAIILGQTVFQFGMIPLMFSKWGARFVCFWGWMFIVASLLFIQLSYLSALEVCLWFLIFHRSAPAESESPVELGEVPPAARQRFSFCVAAFTMVLAAFVLTFPLVTTVTRRLGLPHERIHQVTRLCGLDVPVVFNKTDLKMGDNWPMLYRIRDGNRELVPLNGPDGERLWYHLSDRVYFGNSLRWRRSAIDQDLVAFVSEGSRGDLLIRDIAHIDYNFHGFSGPIEYEAVVYRAAASDMELAPSGHRFEPQKVHAYRFSVPFDRAGTQTASSR